MLDFGILVYKYIDLLILKQLLYCCHAAFCSEFVIVSPTAYLDGLSADQ